MADSLLRAVLTGDIVRSARLGPAGLDAAMAALARGAAAAGAWTGTAPRFTRFRGDGWQCLAPSPALALRAALLLKAHLRREGRGLATRIAIGIGPGELPEGDDLAAAGGPAFRAAGEALDTMRRSARLALAWAEPPPDAALRRALALLADEIARRWTPVQAAALVAALQPAPPIQTALAAELGISQQMVAKHLAAGGHGALLAALDAVEAVP